VPRLIGISIHYVVIAAAIALFLWLVVPRAVDQLGEAIGNVPTSAAELGQQAKQSTGIKHDILVALQKRLDRLPSGTGVVHPALTIGKAASRRFSARSLCLQPPPTGSSSATTRSTSSCRSCRDRSDASFATRGS
jgi:hypothetical protein